MYAKMFIKFKTVFAQFKRMYRCIYKNTLAGAQYLPIGIYYIDMLRYRERRRQRYKYC